MKVCLEVASGVHQGKKIPIAGPHFLIGRDPECQLRPASPSVSKKHCAVIIKEGRVFVKEFGSTNGTFVNDDQVAGHRELKDGDELKAGPLHFVVRLERPAAKTPSAAAPQESGQSDPDSVDMTPPPGTGKGDSDSARLAAILLGAGDDDSSGTVTEEDIPEGSTVFDVPAFGMEAEKKKMDEEKKKQQEPKKKEETGDNASVAGDILRRYQQRPRN